MILMGRMNMIKDLIKEHFKTCPEKALDIIGYLEVKDMEMRRK